MKKIVLITLCILAILIAGCSTTAPAKEAGAPADAAETGKTLPEVVILTDPVWPPFESIDETTKELVGFDIDLIKEIGAVAGFTPVFKDMAFDALIPAVATCQYDAAASAITVTDERKKTMTFSTPYVNIGQLMAVKEDSTLVAKEDFKGKTIGAQNGTTGAIMIAEWEKEGAVKARIYDSVDLAYLDLKNGQVDGVLADSILAYAYVSKLGELKTVGDVYSSEELAVAVCKSKPELLKKIDDAIATLKENGKFQELVDKYLIK